MGKLNLILKSIVSSLPFITIVIAFIVARSVYLMKKRNTGFEDWLMKEDANVKYWLFSSAYLEILECKRKELAQD